MIRRATAGDLGALLALEAGAFQAGDRFSRRQLRHYVTEAHATALVAEVEGRVRGAAIMGWRAGSKAGSLYSIVTDPAHQGLGLGSLLLAACEAAAARRGCDVIVLDVRPDNDPAIAFYRGRGYAVIEGPPRLYPDGAVAVQMAKRLPASPAVAARLSIPYYAQALEHDGGPACLIMAMRRFTPQLPAGPALEEALWHEANGGGQRPTKRSSPLGLGAAARRRGYAARVVLPQRDGPSLVAAEAAALGVARAIHRFDVEDIAGGLAEGLVPMVRAPLRRARGPGWAIVTAWDGRDVWLLDPAPDSPLAREQGGAGARLSAGDFRAMLRQGDPAAQALLLIGPR